MIVGQLVSESMFFRRSCSNLEARDCFLEFCFLQQRADAGRLRMQNLDFQDVTMSAKCPRMSATVAEYIYIYIYFEMSANIK